MNLHYVIDCLDFPAFQLTIDIWQQFLKHRERIFLKDTEKERILLSKIICLQIPMPSKHRWLETTESIFPIVAPGYGILSTRRHAWLVSLSLSRDHLIYPGHLAAILNCYYLGFYHISAPLFLYCIFKNFCCVKLC